MSTPGKVPSRDGNDNETVHERRWFILVVLCISLLVIVLDNSILNVAIPTLVRELDASNSQLQWMVDSYVIVFAGLLLTAGALGDRFGRRLALQFGFVIFGLGSVLAAMSDTANQLIATRGFMGIGGAFIMPATLSIITNVFPARERGRAIGVWAGTAGIAVALGPLTGGFLLEHFYWGSIFLVNIPIVLFGLVAGFVLIPESKDPAARRLDPVGAVLSIVALSVLLYGIIEGPSHGWTAPTTLGAFAIGVILVAGFLAWEAHSAHPMLPLEFFKNPRFSVAGLAISAIFFAMFGSVFLLTQYMQFVLGYSPLEAGVRLLPFALTIMVVAPTSAFVVRVFGAKRVVASGLAFVGVALLLFTGLETSTPYWDIAWRMMLMALGMGLTMAPATDSIMGSLPLAQAGVGSAVNDTVRQVGGALGIAVVGSVSASVYTDRIDTALGGAAVPAEAAEVARSSIGGALGVAAEAGNLPIPDAASIATNLASTANEAFVASMHTGVLVAAAVAFVGSVVTLIWLPARASAHDLAAQDADFGAGTSPS